MKGFIVFREGDRVKLKNNFDNEPGIVFKGTEGTITVVMDHDSALFDYFVEFDNPDNNPVISEVQGKIGGFPLFEYEIEAA